MHSTCITARELQRGDRAVIEGRAFTIHSVELSPGAAILRQRPTVYVETTTGTTLSMDVYAPVEVYLPR